MNSEMIVCQEKLKKNIYLLIENNRLEDAKELLNQYENIISDDIEIYSIKSVIAIMQGNEDEAEHILKEGLLVDEQNFDLNYNFAYLYRLKNNNLGAYEFYCKAINYTTDMGMKNEINEILDVYNEMEEIVEYNTRKKNNENTKPKVTIIIPTYNQKKYLKKAIESCLEQDYEHLEILVGDDCSTDGTDIMMKIYENNQKIKYIRNKINLGAGNNTRNLLYNYIDSKFAMILNHDDYLIKSDYISLAVGFLIQNPTLSFVWANCKILNEETQVITQTSYKVKKITSGIDYFINYETTQCPHITGTMTTVFDVDKLKSTGYGDEKTKSKDTLLYLKLMLTGEVGFIEECVATYRIHKESISFNMPLEFDNSTINEFEILKSYVQNNMDIEEKLMEQWINNRVFTYIYWRVSSLLNNGDKESAISLLISIKDEYSSVYKEILNSCMA